MTIVNIETLNRKHRAEALTEMFQDCINRYVAEVCTQDPPEVVQMALYNLGKLYVPCNGGCCFRLPDIEEV